MKFVVYRDSRGCSCGYYLFALALIPEAIAFSIIAGVDPKSGAIYFILYCCCDCFVGGRPGMISAATGAMALLMVTLVKETWSAIFISSHNYDRIYSNPGRLSKIRSLDAFCIKVSRYWLCKCLGYSNFYGSIA